VLLIRSTFPVKPQILYRKKLHTVYSVLYKPTLKNGKNALAYTFKAGSWQI